MPKMCGIFHHPLVKGVHVTNPKHIAFIRKTRSDFRSDDEICEKCRNTMEYMYELKKERARKLHAARRGDVSTISSSDSIDTMVKQTPMHRKALSRSNHVSTQSSNYKSNELNNLLSSMSNSNSEEIGRQDNVNSKDNGSSEKSTLVQENRAITTRSKVISLYNDESNGLNNLLSSMSNINSEEIGRQDNVNSKDNGSSDKSTLVQKNRVIATTPKDITKLGILSNLPLVSPTIYTDNAENFADCLNVRLSQQPTTSAAAIAAISKSTPKSRGIRAFFTPLPTNSAGARKTRTPLLAVSPSPTVSDLVTNNQEQPSTSSLKRRLVTHPVSDTDSTNTESAGVRKTRSSLLAVSPSSTVSDLVTNNQEQPSTSSRKRRLVTHPVGDTDGTSTESDDEPLRSLNYFNPDVRFANYQPIPKKRPFKHDNNTIMDIYLQGLTGG